MRKRSQREKCSRNRSRKFQYLAAKSHCQPAADDESVTIYKAKLSSNIKETLPNLMEVVRSNFKEHLEAVLEDIEKCSYISFDGEFTGISNESFKAMSFDTVAERYTKLRKGNMDYLMCQVGVCMFFQADDGSYTAKPYNFYVLPRQFFNTTNSSPEFVCQASCIQFLATHGFDFNKVFLDGIPYLRPAQESKIKDQLMEKEEAKHNSTPILSINAGDHQFVDDIMEKVAEYLQNKDVTEPLKLEPCSAWRRKLTYQNIQKKYPDNIHLQSVKDGRNPYIEVTKSDAEQKLAQEKERHNKKMQQLNDAVGFSLVAKAISHSNKVVIGHNMLLDVMYIVSQFLAELPESYEEFKAMTTELFPKLLDTKVMSSTYLFKDNIQFNSLDEMNTVLESPLYSQVQIDVPEEFPAYHKPNKDTKYHNAAYDAFVTGKCFAIMAQHVGRKAEPPVKNLASSSKLLTPFINKLFVNRIQDIPYMNLGGPEVDPDRDHMYHLTFPNTWGRSDINQVFHPCLIYVQWIDEMSAMVSLQKRTDNIQVKKQLKNKTQRCVVMPYQKWHTQRATPRAGKQSKTQPSPAVTKKAEKRKIASPDSKVILKATKMDTSRKTEPAAPAKEEEEGVPKKDKIFEECSW